MKVLVCGGRDYGEVPFGCPPDSRPYYEKRAHAQRRNLHTTLDTLKIDRGITAIIHGGARGADNEAGYWARRQLISEERYDADWDRDGKAAGPIRNQRMLDEGKPDVVVAFPGGKGTAMMIKLAEGAGAPVIRAAGW